ncbi:MAG: hypothetical protein AAB388_00855 [Patescibacteria group bacterium]
MELEPMSGPEIVAFYNYAEALLEGKVPLPPGMTKLGENLEAVIKQMLLLRAVLRTTDYNSVDAVRREFWVVNSHFLHAALEYQPTPRYLN